MERYKIKKKVLDDITEERKAQIERWGGAAHDDRHNTSEFTGYIEKHNKRAGAELEGTQDQRYALVRVAALAIAAIESFDRTS